MSFWISFVLLLLSAAGIVFLCRAKQGKERKTAYNAGIAALAIIAAAAACYIAITLLFVNSVA